MSYTPTEWKAGDVVTSEKLNKLEQGVASGSGSGLIVHVVADPSTEAVIPKLDKTYRQIADAIESGIMPVFLIEIESGAYNVDHVDSFGFSSKANAYGVHFLIRDVTFTTDTEDGYPTAQGSSGGGGFISN